jgi:hypothetical protein
VLLFEVNNRGNKLAVANFNEGVSGGVADRNGLTSPGDGWLMRDGYTMVWSGWEMDVLDSMNRISMPPIVADNLDGSPITGLVRSEVITPVRTTSLPISLSQQIQNYPVGSYDSYPTVSLDNRTAFADGFLPSLTVRAREQDPRVAIASSEWSFGACQAGKPPAPDEKHICYPAGFEPGRPLRIDLPGQGPDGRRPRASRRCAISAPSCAIHRKTIPARRIRSTAATMSRSSRARRRAAG